MKKISIFFIGILMTSSFALANEDVIPTVTLTQDQLQRLIQAESAKAIATFVAQEKLASAKDVYDLAEKAFTKK